MFDFPSSPTTNQQVTGSGGQVYTFDGTKWNATATAAGVSSWNTRTGAVMMSSGDVTTALTFTPYNATNPSGYQTAAQVTTALAPYAPLAAPVFTGDARAVTPAYGDNDTSVATSAFVQSAVAPAANNVGRNLIHNPVYTVQQRGAGPWTSGGYTADRWGCGFNTDTISISIISLTDTDRTALGDELAQYALQNVFTGSTAAGAYNQTLQGVEYVRRLAGRTITASFWAKANSGTPKLGIGITQVFGSGSNSPSSPVSMSGQSVTIAAAWTRYSVTFAVPSIVGKTVGNLGGDSTNLEFWYSASSTYATRSGSVGVQSGTIQLYGVQIEYGSVATPLAVRDPADELALCQRFYVVCPGQTLMGYGGGPGQNVYNTVAFPVSMRTTPTVAQTYGSGTNTSSAGTTNITTLGFQSYATSGAAGSFQVFANPATASADL